MKLRTVHQFHPTIAHGDAIGNDCLELQDLLCRAGVRSSLFAQEAKPELHGFVRDWRELAAEPIDRAALLVHVSMGDSSLDEVARLPIRKAVVYHNITPARFFAGVSESNRQFAELGREQLKRLAAQVELGIGDSEFNRRELDALGYARTAIVPILVDWSAYDVAPDPIVLRDLAAGGTAIVAMGQLLPQKAIHDVIAGFAAYRRADPRARLYLVGSSAMSGDYLARLHRDVAGLGIEDAVVFAGKVSMAQWVAYYRGATVLLTLSDHEGFWVPGLEAMHFGVPILAHAAGAIPDTVGDAGVLLGAKSPDSVAAALERIVGDRALRADLIAKGQRRLEAFTPAAVAVAFRAALARVGWEIAEPARRTLAVLSSDQRCGVHDYARALADGLRENGHDVTFVGVRHADAADLRHKVAGIPRGIDAVIVEHEAGIFSDIPFVRALLSLRRRGIPVLLSMHEIEPEKFHHYRMLSRALHYRPHYGSALEVIRALFVALRIANWFVRYRAVLALMGGLPWRIVTHSDRSHQWIGVLTPHQGKVEQLPLLLIPLEDTTMPADDDAKRALRERLGLPVDRFIFISPGFFFRRKRFIEVIRALPANATLVLSGTQSSQEPEYFDEVMAFIKERGGGNVIVHTEFEGMGEYVAASDCVVLFYEDVFQSAVATQALWAGLPAIYSGVNGFRIYQSAGQVARDTGELADAMREIQLPERYAELRDRVAAMRRLIAPRRIAARYLVDLE